MRIRDRVVTAAIKSNMDNYTQTRKIIDEEKKLSKYLL
jgi:hypothetical protein